MAFDPDEYLASSAPAEGAFDPDAYLAETEEKSIGGFARNVGKDVVDMAKGIGTLATGLVKDPVDTTTGLVKGLPGALKHEAERIGIIGEKGQFNTEFPYIHPIQGAKTFLNAAYEKPVTTALDIAPAAGALKGLKGTKALETAGQAGELAGTVAKEGIATADDIARTLGVAGTPADEFMRTIPRAPQPMNFPPEANQILREAPKAPPPAAPNVPPQSGAGAGAAESVPMGTNFTETVKNLSTKIPGEVKAPMKQVGDFLEAKYGQAVQQPGLVQNLGKTLEQKARGMRLQEMGGTPGMGRQLRDRFGEDFVNQLSDLSEAKGIGKGFFNWQTGQNIEKLMGESGKAVGTIREIAKKRGAIHNMDDLVGKIRAELDPKYLKGSGKSQQGAYLKALEDIKSSAPDVESLAETLTAKNKLVKKNRMMQPIGAPTDVYNMASRLNNELVNRFLKPAESELYRTSLRDFSASKIFDKMYGFTYGKDMFGRSTGGPWAPWNYVKDIGGRKLVEKVFSRVGKKMQRSPEAFKNPLALTDDVLDSVNEALDEIIEQMGKGSVDQ